MSDVLKIFCPLHSKGLNLCTNINITCCKQSTRITYKKVTRRKVIRVRTLHQLPSFIMPEKTCSSPGNLEQGYKNAENFE